MLVSCLFVLVRYNTMYVRFVICTGITLFALVLHFLHWYYAFCTGITRFALVLRFLHCYYTFCTGITLFALVLRFLHWCYSLTALLSANQNRVIFSCTVEPRYKEVPVITKYFLGARQNYSSLYG